MFFVPEPSWVWDLTANLRAPLSPYYSRSGERRKGLNVFSWDWRHFSPSPWFKSVAGTQKYVNSFIWIWNRRAELLQPLGGKIADERSWHQSLSNIFSKELTFHCLSTSERACLCATILQTVSEQQMYGLLNGHHSPEGGVSAWNRGSGCPSDTTCLR